MKWLAAFFAPAFGVLTALNTLLETVTVTTTAAVDTMNLVLLAQSTNALATGVVTGFTALFATVFLVNAALVLALPSHR